MLSAFTTSLRARSLRSRCPIYVDTPAFTPLSGGVRALYLLAHHLARLGYDAYVTTSTNDQHIPFPVQVLTPDIAAQHEHQGARPIVVYPEVVSGNPRGATTVVRYLLNHPDYLVPGISKTFGTDDVFICFDPTYAPSDRRAFDMYMPLVDRSIYHPPKSSNRRSGYVLFSHRIEHDPAQLPAWLSPRTTLTIKAPRPHTEIAELYRNSIAMVTWERSSAIYEALCCRCPVICIEHGAFKPSTYQKRFSGSGLIWGFDLKQITPATSATHRFIELYDNLEGQLDKQIKTAFDHVILSANQRNK